MSANKNLFIVRVVIAIIFFSTLVSIGITSLIAPDRQKSALENRSLTTIEKLDENKRFSTPYFETAEKYFNDQLILRDFFIQVDGRFKKNVLQQNIIDGVYIDKDFEMYAPVPVGNEDPEVVAERISNFAKKINSRGVNVVFVPAPNKATFYEDRLPFYVNFASYGNEVIDKVLDNVGKETNALDIRKTIEEVSKTHKPYFYTDHHWTIESVYKTYEEIMRKFLTITDNYGEPIPRESYYSYTYKQRPFYGSFARRASLTPSARDYITLLKPKFDIHIEMKIGKNVYTEFNFEDKLKNPSIFANRYEAYGSDDRRIVVTNYSNPNAKKLLILKDSYSNPMLQFLTPHTSELHALDVRHYNEMTISEYIAKYDIDDVLIIQNNLGLALNPATSSLN